MRITLLQHIVIGSAPHLIGTVLDNEGIDNCRVVSTDDMSMYGTYIMSFWTEPNPLPMIHTIMFSHTPQGCVAYNLFGDGRTKQDFDPGKYSDRYICGYYLY